jgi:hypothetical protein
MPAIPPMPPIPDIQAFNINGDDADLIITEGGQTLKVSWKENQKHLVATDNDGQVLFDGPIETDEQRKAVPAEIAEKLEKYKEQVDQVKAKAPGEQRRVRILRDGGR